MGFLRFVLALLVAVGHLTAAVPGIPYDLSSNAVFAVRAFFMLSGFYMALVLSDGPLLRIEVAETASGLLGGDDPDLCGPVLALRERPRSFRVGQSGAGLGTSDRRRRVDGGIGRLSRHLANLAAGRRHVALARSQHAWRWLERRAAVCARCDVGPCAHRGAASVDPRPRALLLPARTLAGTGKAAFSAGARRGRAHRAMGLPTRDRGDRL